MPLVGHIDCVQGHLNFSLCLPSPLFTRVPTYVVFYAYQVRFAYKTHLVLLPSGQLGLLLHLCLSYTHTLVSKNNHSCKLVKVNLVVPKDKAFIMSKSNVN